MGIDRARSVLAQRLGGGGCAGSQRDGLRLTEVARLGQELERDRTRLAVRELRVDPDPGHLQITFSSARKSTISLAPSPLSSTTRPALRASAGWTWTTSWVDASLPAGRSSSRSASVSCLTSL